MSILRRRRLRIVYRLYGPRGRALRLPPPVFTRRGPSAPPSTKEPA